MRENSDATDCGVLEKAGTALAACRPSWDIFGGVLMQVYRRDL